MGKPMLDEELIYILKVVEKVLDTGGKGIIMYDSDQSFEGPPPYTIESHLE
jgi:hypothetical protein